MRPLILLLPLALAACGQSNDDPGPGGVSASEARQLNEAAATLDVNAIAADDDSDKDTP